MAEVTRQQVVERREGEDMGTTTALWVYVQERTDSEVFSQKRKTK